VVEMYIIHSHKGANVFLTQFCMFFFGNLQQFWVPNNKHTCFLQEKRKKKKKKNLAQEYEERSKCVLFSLPLVFLVFIWVFFRIYSLSYNNNRQEGLKWWCWQMRRTEQLCLVSLLHWQVVCLNLSFFLLLF
jgi:uncharacterized ion transporter superfamily protein YfcC